MRLLLHLCLVGLLGFSSVAFAHDIYKQIRIDVPDAAMLARILDAGLDPEGMSGKPGGPMEFVASEVDLQELQRLGIRYTVVIHDLTEFYRSRNTVPFEGTERFGYGSMGGFYTLNEVMLQLDSMRLQYPHLITARDSIGRTEQNRGIFIVRMGSMRSDGKPEVLYTSLHHAREPQGMMTVLYYMWWLLENYGSNPEATYLLDNRQQYFIPVVNPDGYEYNRQTSPSGGGNWRKNRKLNTGGSYGVDLNRNYGPQYMWNAPNGGSSTTPSSDTYRGPTPFSEAETQAIDAFMRSHNIRTCFNYHTYSNLLIYPYGYLSRESADSVLFREWAYDMTGENRYVSGTDLQTVAYSTRGNSDDYMYGDSTKYRTYAMTPEVGSSGFWPTRQEIFPLAIENLQANKLLAYYAGHFLTVSGSTLQDAGGNGFLNRGEAFTLSIKLRNKGVGGGSGIAVQASSSLPAVQFTGQVTQTIMVSPRQETTLLFTGAVAANTREGIPVKFFIRISDGDGFLRIDTLTYFIGTPSVLLADDASGGTGRWTTGSGWGTTSNALSPPLAFTDSPLGNYATNANNSLTLVTPLNLSGFNFAELRYYTKWALEPTYDFATVEASTNNGASWTSLRARLSHKGSGVSGGQQPTGSWGYDAYTPGLTWVQQSIDLSNFVNQNLRLRFRLAADGGEQRDGFYVDDIRVLAYTTTEPPILDTGIVVSPPSLTYFGPTGRVFADSVTIKNLTGSPVTVTFTDSVISSGDRPVTTHRDGTLTLQSLLQQLRQAFKQSSISYAQLQSTQPRTVVDPEVYTTIITDERGENPVGAADVYRVRYQFRTSPLGSYHDFQVVLANLPDTNVVIVISVDTDQDFLTGRFPSPLGLGPTSRDIGSEREIVLDGSGLLADSLLGLGRIPAGAVIDATVDTLRIVGTPFLLSVRRDSVLTISTEGPIGGVSTTALGDADGKMNIGVSAIRLSAGSNPQPDFAPQIGHGNIGGETGVSWVSQQPRVVTIAASDSVKIRSAAVAAKPAGIYRAAVLLNSAGRQPATLPVVMNVSTPVAPIINVTPTLFRDTLRAGDSLTHTVVIRNSGGTALSFAVVDTARTPWLAYSPNAGSVDSGTTATLTILVRSTGLRTDTTYRARLAVLSNDPNSPIVPIDVILTVRRITSVGTKVGIPAVYQLYQNYPNPFNPETHIEFDLPQTSGVALRIFSILGQEIGTIVKGELEAGRHSIVLNKDAYRLSSGVYLYRLEAGGFVATRKFVMVK